MLRCFRRGCLPCVSLGQPRKKETLRNPIQALVNNSEPGRESQNCGFTSSRASEVTISQICPLRCPGALSRLPNGARRSEGPWASGCRRNHGSGEPGQLPLNIPSGCGVSAPSGATCGQWQSSRDQAEKRGVGCSRGLHRV